MKTKREVGTEYEQKAAHYLEERGYQILARNVNYPWGEIDLITVDHQLKDLVFVEVRKKAKQSMCSPAESISFPKQRRLKRAIETYLASPEFEQCDLKLNGIRIDLLAYDGEEVSHWKSFL